MLLVVEKGREKEVQAVFDKWDLPSAVIGEVTDDGLLSFYMDGKLEAQIPAEELVLGGGAPQYEREYARPEYLAKVEAFDPQSIDEPKNLKAGSGTIGAIAFNCYQNVGYIINTIAWWVQ